MSRRPVIAVVVAVLALAAGASFGTIGAWVGGGLGLFAWALAWPFIRAPLRSIAPHLPLLLVAAFFLGLLGELVIGRPPASRDHGIHYFQTWILVDELLPRGEITGWSERLANGYPFGDSYPVLGYLWTGALHLVTFGAVSLRASYAWGLALLWALSLVAIGRLARTIASELDRDQDTAKTTVSWAGASAALAWLLDPGASREGGWEYLMFHGVWPQLLSTTLWLLSVVATWRVMLRPSARRISAAALLLAGALLAHPFGLLTSATSFAAWLLVIALAGRDRLAPGAVRSMVSIHALAVALASPWLVAFFASRGSMGRSPVFWQPFEEVTARLIRGTLFHQNGLAWIGPLVVVGLGLAVWRGRHVAWLAAITTLGLLILASDAAITTLRLDLLVPGFKNLQFPRYLIAVKPVAFALAGAGLSVLITAVRRTARPDATLKPWSRLILASALLGPVLASSVADPGRLAPRPVGAVETLQGSSVYNGERALLAALIEERDRLEDGRKLKVAFLRQGMGGGTFPIFSVADAGGALVLDGHVPAVNYQHWIRHRTPQVLWSLGVTHVIHDRPLGEREPALANVLEDIGSFEGFRLARLTDPGRGLGPATTLAGRGHAEVVTWEPNLRRIDVDIAADRDHDVRLRLVQAPYWRWEATLDGEVLETGEVPLLGDGFTGTSIVVPRSGLVELRWIRTSGETAATWIATFAAILCLVALVAGRPLQVRPWLPTARVRWLGWSVATVAAIAIVVSSCQRQKNQLERTWNELLSTKEGELPEEGPQFSRDLVIEHAWQVAQHPKQVCGGLLGKDVRRGCSDDSSEPSLGIQYRPPYLYRCVLVTLGPKGRARVTFSGLKPGEEVRGFLQRVSQAGRGKHLRWRVVDNQKEATPLENTRRSFRVTAQEAGGDVNIDVRNRGEQIEQVCIAAAAFD